MIQKPTIVTALFDIGRDKWDNYQQGYDMYLTWMTSLLMYDTKMVIYTDNSLYETILNKRKICDPNLENTIFVVKKLEELDAHKMFFDRVEQLMKTEEFKKKVAFQVPEMTKPLYNIVIFNKLFYILESIEKKHFDSDFYIWLDAGVLRTYSQEKISGWPNLDKINNGYSDKITFFNHQEKTPYIDPYLHIMSQYRFIHGGCIFIPNNKTLDKLIHTFLNLITYYLDEGYVGSEEKYLDLCYLKNPEDYNVIKCDWRQYFEIFD